MHLRIVIVEDEAIVAANVASYVHTGHRVVGIVSTGEAAIELVRRDCPDLFLMDIVLAGPMSGIEPAERLKCFCETPIVYAAHNYQQRSRSHVSAGCPGAASSSRLLIGKGYS